MFRVSTRIVFVFLFLLTGVCVADDFNEQFLAATCATDSNFVRPETVNNANGIAVGFPANKSGSIVLYCQIDADESNYFSVMQIIGEDNSQNAKATATLFRQDIVNTGPPVEIGSVHTFNQSGVQRTLGDVDLSLNEYRFVYWIKVVINRSDPSVPILVYNVSLMDLL